MKLLHRALGICFLFTVLGEWLVVLAAIEGSSLIQPSPSVSGSGIAAKTDTALKTSAAHVIMSSLSNMTVTPHNTTVTLRNVTIAPSHNVSVTPYNTTVTPSHNVTITPRNSTVKPSSHMSSPSHNMTVTPHNSTTVVPFSPSRNMTVTPHNSTTVMPYHNATIMPSSSSPTPSHSVTPTPTSAPPTPGNFTVKNKMNKTCLFAYMAAKFVVTMKAKTLPRILLPDNASTSGACDNSSDGKPFITLTWQSKGSNYNFTLYFVKVGGNDLTRSSSRWAAANVTFSMKSQGIGSETFHSQTTVLKKVSADVGHSFYCKARMLTLTAVNSSVDVTLMDVKFQPFDVENGEISNKVDDCLVTSTPPDHSTPKPTKKGSNHTVAIAVGCTLSGLVVIIAIAYLIGRRRKRTSAGYRKL